MPKNPNNQNYSDPAQLMQELEKAYQESERKYRELVDLIPLGVFELDLHARVSYINPMGMEMMGYSKRDIEKGVHVFRFVVEEEKERVKAHFSTVAAGMAIEGEEFTAKRKKGNTFPVMMHVYPLFEDGKIVGVRGIAFDLSKPKKIELQLQELLERYEIMLNAIPDLIFRFDKKGRFIDYHANAPEKLHLLPDQFVGKLITEVELPPELRESGVNKIAEALEKGEIIIDEYSMDVPGGHFYFEARYIPIGKDEVINIIQDISHIKLAQDTIRKVEEDKSIVLESMSEMFAYFSPEMEIKWVNKSYAENLGMKQGDFSGVSCYEIWHHREEPCVDCPVILAAKTGKPQVQELKTPDGRYWKIRGYPIFDDAGKLTGMSEFCEEITFQKKAMESLRLTQFSVDQNPDAAFWMNKEARFFYVNETACKKLGYTEEELLKMSVYDIDPLFPEEIWDMHWQEIKKLKTTTIESVHRAKDGHEFPIELMINFIEFDGNEYNCAFARDISERKMNEENLRRAKENAEQANQVKSDFISNISHEIRTPLNSIIGFSDMLRGHLSDPRQKEYAGAIKSAGDSLLMLINDILDLSKIEAGRLDITLEPVNLRVLISEVSQIFAVKVTKKNLDFVIDVHENVPESLMLDKIRIRQVLFNLVGNAVKFSSKGYIRLLVNTLTENIQKNNSLTLEIIVEDSGIGIPEEFHESIFYPFMQVGRGDTKGAEGTGLGLSITKRLVEMMSGRIELNSLPGKGSSFKVRLEDVNIAEIKEITKSDGEQMQSLFHGKHILLVDDSDINRRYVKDNLLEGGVLVSEAKDGKEGIEMAALLKPDLILMDIMMPVMDGYDAVDILKADPELSDIPVMALTALAMKDDIERIANSGFDTFLIKPFHIEDLYEKMSDLLGQYDEIGSDNGDYTVSLDEESEKKYFSFVEAALKSIEDRHLLAWHQAVDMKEFKSIRNFAEGILATGKEMDLRLLVDYGEKLVIYCDNYDIERIDSALLDFPEYVKKMKKIIETQNP